MITKRARGGHPLATWAVWAVLAAATGAAADEPPAAPAPAAAGAETSRELQLEARVRQLEALINRMPDPDHVQRLEEQVRLLTNQVQQLSTRPAAGPGGSAPASTSAMAGDAGALDEIRGGPASMSPAAPAPAPRFDMPEPIPSLPLRARFGPGFEMKTADEEFVLQFHDLTQLDGRFYQQTNQSPVTDTFAIPRQWFIFSGRVGKPFEYYLSIAEGFDTMNILDVFLNVNFDKRAQFRIGRFKSPFAYEFWATPVQGLINGEWSLFFNNFALNRVLGAMGWGQLFDDRLDYAVGLFNATANSFLDLSNPKDLVAFVNFAPWEMVKGSPLENLNIGGSVIAGDRNHIPVPQVLRTLVPTVGNAVLGVPFLAFNGNVLQTGFQSLWDAHLAYFYKQLSVMAEWEGGFADYALNTRGSHPTRLPIESYYISLGYFLTGETVASRGMVRPHRAFDLRPGKVGPGAWELGFRYNFLNVSRKVFTEGLADPNVWTNQLYMTDATINWYWNQYIRVMFDWEHAVFGNPVVFRQGGFQKTSDLFWIRFQVWF